MARSSSRGTGTGAGGAAATGGTQQGAAATFTVAPSKKNQGVLDYTSKQDCRLYEQASAGLMSEDKFDSTEDHLQDFLAMLKTRAVSYGWEEQIMMIPTDPADPMGKRLSLLDNHGNLTLAQIQSYEESYINAQDRNRQNMDCLYNA